MNSPKMSIPALHSLNGASFLRRFDNPSSAVRDTLNRSMFVGSAPRDAPLPASFQYLRLWKAEAVFMAAGKNNAFGLEAIKKHNTIGITTSVMRRNKKDVAF
jgi:hypothetical protein